METTTLKWVLLAGGLKRFPLAEEVGCAVLDLRLTREHTALGLWAEHARALERATGIASRMTVVYGGVSIRPKEWSPTDVPIEYVADPRSLRGPAGLVKDICADEPHGGLILVAEAKRCLTGPLAPMVREHLGRGATVTVAANADGAPAGLYLLRRGALETVPGAGFVDLKEQWLRRASAAGMDVRVHRLAGWGSMPLRTREQFLRAAMALANVAPDSRLTHFSIFDPGRPTPGVPFNVIAEDAAVGAGAVVMDSVVMDGCEIGAGAVVARSVVAPGARVQPGAEVVDAVVGPRGVLSEVGGRAGAATRR